MLFYFPVIRDSLKEIGLIRDSYPHPPTLATLNNGLNLR